MFIDVVGSINMDLVGILNEFPGIGETVMGKKFFTAPGGKGANQAVAASRMGAQVRFIGCVGKDSFGYELINDLQRDSVDTSCVRQCSDISTGTAMIIVNKEAQNEIVVIPGANSKVASIDVKKAIAQKKDLPKFVLFQFEIPFSTILESAKFYKKHGVKVIINPAPATSFGDELYGVIDYFIPNEHEALKISGKRTLEDAAAYFLKKGVKVVIITAGERGSLLYDGNVNWIAPYKVQAVDPTAAGDAFIGAFAASLATGKSLDGSIQMGNAAGALAATKEGAQPSLPRREEVECLIAT
jgi:ribokinase